MLMDIDLWVSTESQLWKDYESQLWVMVEMDLSPKIVYVAKNRDQQFSGKDRKQ